MKKIITALLAALMICLCFAACGAKVAIPIEDVIWEVTTVESKVSGNIVACSEAYAEAYPKATVIEMVFGAKDGRATMNCSTTDELAEGFYAKSESGETTLYAIRFDMFSAAAATSFTTNAEGEQVRTLVVDTGDYFINFEAP